MSLCDKIYNALYTVHGKQIKEINILNESEAMEINEIYYLTQNRIFKCTIAAVVVVNQLYKKKTYNLGYIHMGMQT